MVTIFGSTIRATRGDTIEAALSIKTASGEDYVPAAGDVIRFALKCAYDDPQPLIIKTISHDTMMLRLEAAETKVLPARTVPYVYDIELTTPGGTVSTVIAMAQLYITEEVH